MFALQLVPYHRKYHAMPRHVNDFITHVYACVNCCICLGHEIVTGYHYSDSTMYSVQWNLFTSDTIRENHLSVLILGRVSLINISRISLMANLRRNDRTPFPYFIRDTCLILQLRGPHGFHCISYTHITFDVLVVCTVSSGMVNVYNWRINFGSLT